MIIKRSCLTCYIVQVKPDTIIQVWSGDSYNIEHVTQSGFRALFSTCWYLDYISYGQDWDKYYNCEQISESTAPLFSRTLIKKSSRYQIIINSHKWEITRLRLYLWLITITWILGTFCIPLFTVFIWDLRNFSFKQALLMGSGKF